MPTQDLEDMRWLFKLYDTDGSGELDGDEFVQVRAVGSSRRVKDLGHYAPAHVGSDDDVSVGQSHIHA